MFLKSIPLDPLSVLGVPIVFFWITFLRPTMIKPAWRLCTRKMSKKVMHKKHVMSPFKSNNGTEEGTGSQVTTAFRQVVHLLLGTAHLSSFYEHLYSPLLFPPLSVAFQVRIMGKLRQGIAGAAALIPISPPRPCDLLVRKTPSA